MKKKIIIGGGIIIIIVASLIAYLALSLRNTAKAEAEKVLTSFSDATSSSLYCENGYGKGIDNDTPWWEQVYLSNSEPEETAKRVNEYLASKGYTSSNDYVEKIDSNIDDGTLIREGKDWYNRDYAYWMIEGGNNDFSMITRVSEDLTLNNCFATSNKDSLLDVKDFTTKIVIKLQDDQ